MCMRALNPKSLYRVAVHIVQLDHSVHGLLLQSLCKTLSSKFSKECPISLSIELLKEFPSLIMFVPSAFRLATDINWDAAHVQTSIIAKSPYTLSRAVIFLFWYVLHVVKLVD